MVNSHGMSGHEPHQRTFFGLNRGIEAHGMYMNVYVANVVQAQNGNKDQNIAFNQQVGMLSSALEHSVPEQIFTDPNETDPTKRPNGFSAAKALSIAAAQGQRIYTITPATQNIALPNIRLDATSMSEIRAALASGKHVTTHTDLLTVPGYKGAGYVILDPDTGAGIYKISGGKNGSFLAGFGIGLAAAFLIIGVIAGSGLWAVIALIGIVIGLGLALGGLLYNLLNMLRFGDDFSIDMGCYFSGILADAGLASLFAGIAGFAKWFFGALGLTSWTLSMVTVPGLPSPQSCTGL